jgi:hypothetical protein
MKVLIAPNESVAALLQGLVKPGVEVVALGQDIDSQSITDVYIVVPKDIPPLQLIQNASRWIKGRTTEKCELSIFAV